SLAVALLVPAGVLLAAVLDGRRAAGVRLATLALGVAAVTEVGWALLPSDPEVLPAPGLHREGLLMVALASMVICYSFGLARLVPRASAWRDSLRRLGGWLSGLAVLMMVVVLAHEALLYEVAVKKTPLAMPGVIAVALGLVVLVWAGISFAVVP